jgi:hypothetical protein
MGWHIDCWCYLVLSNFFLKRLDRVRADGLKGDFLSAVFNQVSDIRTPEPRLDRKVRNRFTPETLFPAFFQGGQGRIEQAPDQFETIIEGLKIAHATRRIALRTHHYIRQVIREQMPRRGCLLPHFMLF